MILVALTVVLIVGCQEIQEKPDSVEVDDLGEEGLAEDLEDLEDFDDLDVDLEDLDDLDDLKFE